MTVSVGGEGGEVCLCTFSLGGLSLKSSCMTLPRVS